MSKRSRKAEQKRRLEEKVGGDSKKAKYAKMKKEGILGANDLEKYSLMYERLNEDQSMFPSPSENPKRPDYNRLRAYICSQGQ